jgi:hypothetical protein
MSPAPAPADDVGAAHLVPGTRFPDIALPATLGGEINLVTWQGSAIVYVYPWTGRPGLADPPGWDDIPGAQARRRRLLASVTPTWPSRHSASRCLA